MIARFPGTCAHCGARFPAGAELARAAGGGWALRSCLEPAAPARPAPGSAAEVAEMLLRARAVAAREDALAAAAVTGSPAIAGGRAA